jgi:NADP-dependent 3-hydroxy acid dehydrogenase YdfG
MTFEETPQPAPEPVIGTPSRSTDGPLHAVVTGASSGIGAATVRALRAAGWEVTAAARRADRLGQLAAETGARAEVLDVTDQDSVDRLVREVTARGPVNAVINNAGGAFGLEPVAEADTGNWVRMYDVNVLGSMRITRGFLPAVRASGHGSFVFLTSTAALAAYEGGAGYVAAKAAQQALARTLRLEEAANNVRVIEVAPGMVHTEEFSLNRLGGDTDAAEKVYAGVANPLTAADVADTIVYALNAPLHVNVDTLVLRPLAQAANHKVVRAG